MKRRIDAVSLAGRGPLTKPTGRRACWSTPHPGEEEGSDHIAVDGELTL